MVFTNAKIAALLGMPLSVTRTSEMRFAVACGAAEAESFFTRRCCQARTCANRAVGGKPCPKMYAKVFTQILDSSLAENYQARHVFEDFLKLCDVNGVVDATHEAIARRTNVPLPIMKEAIAILEAPDPESRNPAHEGRRIVLLDPQNRNWGWMIVNYAEYRKMVTEEQRREKTLQRVKKFRNGTKIPPPDPHPEKAL